MPDYNVDPKTKRPTSAHGYMVEAETMSMTYASEQWKQRTLPQLDQQQQPTRGKHLVPKTRQTPHHIQRTRHHPRHADHRDIQVQCPRLHTVQTRIQKQHPQRAIRHELLAALQSLPPHSPHQHPTQTKGVRKTRQHRLHRPRGTSRLRRTDPTMGGPHARNQHTHHE